MTIDTTAPGVTITTHPANPSSSSSASFTFTTNDAGAGLDCKVDAGDWAACSSPSGYSGLADGAHTFTVRATATGNAASDSYGWTIDTVAPTVSISAHPGNPSASSSATFSFASNDQTAGLRCRMDGGAYAACTPPGQWNLPPLRLAQAVQRPQGRHAHVQRRGDRQRRQRERAGHVHLAHQVLVAP